jgi:hypothetical protein
VKEMWVLNAASIFLPKWLAWLNYLTWNIMRYLCFILKMCLLFIISFLSENKEIILKMIK